MGDDLMGFLSDFRSATAAKAAPVESKPRGRRLSALASEPGPEVPYYAPPGQSTPHADDVPYYTPTSPSAVQAEPIRSLPPSDDFPYYEPPPVIGAAAPGPNWGPPQGEPVDRNPPSQYPPTTMRRPPMWIIGAVVAGAAVVAVVGAMFVLKSSSLNGLTADQVMAKTIAAAHKAGTFHVDATESQGGQVVHLSIDVGTAGGNITSTVSGHSMQLRVVQGGVYLRGDAAALSQMGFSDSSSQQYAEQWLAIPATSPDIQQMVQSLDANQIIDQFLHLSGPLSRMPAGQRGGVSIQGTVPDNQFNQGSGGGDTANLVVSGNQPFVPVSISFSDSDNGSTQMMFSHWGEHVALTVPPNPVAVPPGAGS